MKTWLKRAAAAVLSLSLLAAPVLAAAETAGSSTLNLSDDTVYTYSTQSVTSDSGKQTNLHENIFTYRKEAQVRPVVAFGSTLYGTSAMNKTVKTLEEQGEPDGPSAWDGYAACVAADTLNRSRGTNQFLPIEMMDKPALYK